MYALTDYAHFKAISSLPLSGDMLPSALMSNLLALLPADHQACFFLHGAFLKRLPSNVRPHLVHDWLLDPLSLALLADKIYQSGVSFPSAMNHVSASSDECPIQTVCAPSASSPFSQCSPTPGPCQGHSHTAASTSHHSDSPSLSWYHRNQADQAQNNWKLAGQQVNSFSLAAGSTSSSLVHLQDKLSSHHFLVDSRSSV